jgi:tungstate transport system substrate-binding protein
MPQLISALCIAFFAAMLPAACGGLPAANGSIILATTTSTQDTGLLDVLVPHFERETGVTVKVIAVGTGAALRMASAGDADVVLTHAPATEKEYVDGGHLIEGRRVMHNDFVIVGPPGDPAGVRSHRSITAAMRAIAAASVFVSRGDDSGTHKQELALWKAAGVSPQAVEKREETGQGMGATLNVADQKRGYVLTDRATYLALRKRLDLAIVFEGDPDLLNVYRVYVVNPAKHRRVNTEGARAFAHFLVSAQTQRTIGEFKRQEYGQSLFVPDAVNSSRK